jgi:hypothetical protein
MQLNVLLLPVLGGFLFLSIFHRSAYFLARQNVATLTFWLAVTGLALLAIARAAVMMCQYATSGPEAVAIPLICILVVPLLSLMVISLISFGLTGLRTISPPVTWIRQWSWRGPVGLVLLATSISVLRSLAIDVPPLFPRFFGVSIHYVWAINLCLLLTFCVWWAKRVRMLPVAIMLRASLVGLLYVTILVAVAFHPYRTRDLWLGFSAPTAKEIASEELGTTLLATVLGPLFAWTLNLLYPRAAVQSHLFAKRAASSLDRLFYRATQRGKMVMLTLDDGKVYCGYIDWIPGNPNAADAFLEVQPVFSGYRESEGKRVQLPVSYASFYKKLPSSEWVQFRKIVPIAKIAAAGEFDPGHFDAFAQQAKVVPPAPDPSADASSPAAPQVSSLLEGISKGPINAVLTVVAILWALTRGSKKSDE